MLSFLVELPLETYADHLFDDFAPDADFRVGTARALMWMSQLAYEVRDAQHKVKPVLKRWGLQPVSLIAPGKVLRLPLSSTRGLIATGRGATIAGFCRHRSGRRLATGSRISISERAPATSIADLRTPLTPFGAMLRPP